MSDSFAYLTAAMVCTVISIFHRNLLVSWICWVSAVCLLILANHHFPDVPDDE